jgi:hypothetical protein
VFALPTFWYVSAGSNLQMFFVLVALSLVKRIELLLPEKSILFVWFVILLLFKNLFSVSVVSFLNTTW